MLFQLVAFALLFQSLVVGGSFVAQSFPTAFKTCALSRKQSRFLSTIAPPSTKKLTPEAQELEEVFKEKSKTGKLVVAQIAPAVRVAFSEEFGEEPGAFPPGVLVASLKALGFDLVLDTNTGADLTICEEGTELLHRIMLREERKSAKAESGFQDDSDEPLPLFTSCCPGWMFFVEKSEPDLIPFISTCKSPHMMFGAVVKHYSEDLFGRDPAEVYFTSVMPCIRKRSESDKPAFAHEGVRDVDNVITTKDLGKLLRLHNIDPSELEPLPYDSPFQETGIDHDGLGSGAGQLFGATGGVMEAAVRSVYELLTGGQLPRLELDEVRGLDGVKEAVVPLYNEETGKGLKTELRVAVANGLGNAKKLIKMIRDSEASYDFVEIMACPGGCIGGGGQPKGEKGAVQKRLDSIYKLDKSLPIRRSHENPTIQTLYERHLGEMGGHEAHKLLHVKQVYGGKDAEADAPKSQH